jgi:hypothetical protein
MTRLFSLAAVGLLGAGLMLATPQESHAQGLGVNVNVGHTGFSLYTGPQYVTPYVVPPPAPVGVYVNTVAPYYPDPCLTWPYTVYPTYYRYPYHARYYDYHRDHHHVHHR